MQIWTAPTACIFLPVDRLWEQNGGAISRGGHPDPAMGLLALTPLLLPRLPAVHPGVLCLQFRNLILRAEKAHLSLAK